MMVCFTMGNNEIIERTEERERLVREKDIEVSKPLVVYLSQ